ncbi:MAG: TlpA disulfide reductase family protein [bacterium]|nr:TlpA disulfide reductase family protein [bacterium]
MNKQLIFKISGMAIISLAILLIFATMPVLADINDKIEKDNERELEVGMTPPDFTVTDVNGEEFTLSELAGETPVIIDFWATWCGPCRAEIPNLVEFANLHEGEVRLIGISLDQPDNLQTVLDFMGENEIPYQIVYDEGNQDLSDQYYVTGIPALFIIGADGKLLNIHVGYNAESNLIGDLEEELGLESAAVDE